ncbi:MAG: hypothetical protein Q7T76_17475, partial [Ferruginibacter sp.]|nr:hypothetical protein [Ferruginibacter sp.]
IRLEVGIDSVKCFLDDVLLMTYTEPAKVFCIAGRDEASGDVILKIVNAAAEPAATTIQLNNLPGIKTTGELVTLSSKTGEEENSYDTPTKTIPVIELVDGINKNFKRVFPPFSISVLRVKTK